MTEAIETIILEDGSLKITNLRVVFGSKTYAVSNITSVNILARDSGGGILPVLLMLAGLGVGLLFLMASIGDGKLNLFVLFIGAILGIYLIVKGLRVYSASKPVYIVTLGSSSGEINILQSPDKVHIQRIVDAINEAIISRG